MQIFMNVLGICVGIGEKTKWQKKQSELPEAFRIQHILLTLKKAQKINANGWSTKSSLCNIQKF